MKKIFKKSNIFAFILGALIFGSIGVVSAYTIFANDIGYTPKDTTWEVDNVKDAIDELYMKTTVTLNDKDEQINDLKNQINIGRVLYIYSGTSKTSSWSARTLGYGFYQNGRGYLEQLSDSSSYYLNAVKACNINATMIIWNGTGDATNTPQIKLYKNGVEAASVSNTKNNGEYNLKTIKLSLEIGDRIDYSMYGAGNVHTSYLVYFQLVSNN